MKNRKVRSKVRRINWREVIFALRNKQVIAAFYQYRSEHDVSDNRSAYYVLNHYYSTTYIKLLRDLYEDYGCEYDRLVWASINIPKASWL